MKVRIGVGVGAAGSSGDDLAALGADLEETGFDSIWLPDVLSAPGDDPLAALAYVAGLSPRLKLGATLVLPGRNPVRLAKELATLDRLSGGRLLVTLVLGIRRRRELEAMAVHADERGSQIDELMPLLRRLWSEDDVDHAGALWSLQGATVEPKPVQQPLELWLGGTAPSALRRAGELADGWLPSLCTPDEAASGRGVIEEQAAMAGRFIDPEHFGVSIGYLHRRAPAELARRLGARRPGAAPDDLVPRSLAGLRELMERFVDVGFSKFVVRPVVPPASWRAELEKLAAAVGGLQS
ncbi:MAG: LLM class flavin-dependent oxidoreductase [Acidimicrobiales bacterium]